MKYFLICLSIYAGAWALRLVMYFLCEATAGHLEKKKNAVSGILNAFVLYIFSFVVLLSYDLFLPLIFFGLRMFRTFSWIMSLTILASMIFASVTCTSLVKENICNYGFGKGYCIATAFVVNILNVNLICPAITSLFRTSYEKDFTILFDTFTIIVFIFDVVLLVSMLKQTKKANKSYGNGESNPPIESSAELFSDDTCVNKDPSAQIPTSSCSTSTDRLFCRKCGSQLPLDSDYCNKCGTKVKTI